MRIRRPLPDEWMRIGELAEQLVEAHYAFDRWRFVHPDTLRAAAYVERVRNELASGDAMVHVAEDSGAIAGFVFAGIEQASWKELRPAAGYIHDLVVNPSHRRRGVGRALIDAAIAWIEARGITRVMLWTAPANVGAQQLFARLGFEPTMIEMTLALDRTATRP